MEVYLDHAATTKIRKEALEIMLPTLENVYGNPSAIYSLGQEAARMLAQARETIAKCLGAQPREIIFTSGGSESDNQAILSAARIGKTEGKKHIISAQFEHHAVLHTLEKLQREDGFEVTLLDIPANGILQPEKIEEAIKDTTVLVTIMFANNEIGTIQPIKKIAEICHQKGVLFHTDAVQAVGHIPMNLKEIDVDMLSLSAHKFGGPKGAGVLYAKSGVLLSSLIEGGMQERGKRAGTENLPSIVGMAKALEIACFFMEENTKKITKLREKLLDGLLKIPYSKLNGDRKNRLPGNINICFEGIEDEVLLLLLNGKNIAASAGSACAAGSIDPSHVLMSIGLPLELARASIRLTLGEENTSDQIDYVIQQITEQVVYLREMSSEWKKKEKGELQHCI